MNHTYQNSFYNPHNRMSKPFFTCEHRPVKHKGFEIYNRIKSISKGGDCWDIVKDGVCIGMNAGLNGAKRRIDEGRFPQPQKARKQ